MKLSQVIFLGAPGSGKGTQAKRLVNEFGYKHISTGDLLRKEISSESELGKKVSRVMSEGKLVNDEIVLELLKANCDLNSYSYIFDGFPRNDDQAKALDEYVLKSVKRKAVFFDIPLEILKERIINRRTCSNCGAIYNLKTNPSPISGKCSECGEEKLEQRKDDMPETVENRLEIFKETINPVLDYYETQGNLVRIDATSSPEQVFQNLKNLL